MAKTRGEANATRNDDALRQAVVEETGRVRGTIPDYIASPFTFLEAPEESTSLGEIYANWIAPVEDFSMAL